MNICANCKATITYSDIAIFKTGLIKHGYAGEILNSIPDLCACCSELRDRHINDLDEYDSLCGY